MSIQIMGKFNNAITNVDGTAYNALTVTFRPIDYGLLGMFRVAALSGTMTAGLGAASDIFQSRWTDASRIALIWAVSLDGMGGSSTVFTAGFANFSVFVARNWTADGTGGTVMTPVAESQSLRTNMGSSIMGTVRGPTTGALGIGTRTLDTQAIGQITCSIGVNANVNYIIRTINLFGVRRGIGAGSLRQPLVLAYNEGLVVQATVPATGTWQVGVSMFWSEVGIY